MFNSEKNDWKGVLVEDLKRVNECMCEKERERIIENRKETSHVRVAPWLAGNLNVASAMGCSPKQKGMESCFVLLSLTWILASGFLDEP